MAANGSFFKLLLCTTDSGHSYSVWSILSIGLSVISVLVNGLHVYVLSRLLKQKKLRYLLILIHLSLSDMLTSSVLIAVGNIPLDFLSSYGPLAHQIGVYCAGIITCTALLSRVIFLALSYLDRYVAICQPMNYDASLLLRRLHLWLLLGWLFALVYSVAVQFLNGHNICYLYAMTISDQMWYYVNFSAMVTVFLTVSLVLFFLVRAEISRMSERSLETERESLKNSVRYLMVITIFFTVCLAPCSIEILLFAVLRGSSATRVYGLVIIPQNLYGFLNTVVYGWVNPPYRKSVRRYLLVVSPDATISPS